MAFFTLHRAVNIASPVNRSHALARGLAHWWLCLPGLMGGQYLPDLMSLPDNRFTVGRHAQRTTSGADAYSNAPTWGAGTNRLGGFGHMMARNLAIPVGGMTCGDVMEVGQTWDFTWIANVYLSSFNNANDTIMVQIGTGGTTFLTLILDNTTHVARMAFPVGGGGTLNGTTTLALGQWWQIAVTWVAADSNRLTIYLNGKQDATGTGFTGRSITAPTTPFNIAADLVNGRKIAGSFDDFRVYKRGLSAAEVKEVYQNSQAGYLGLLNRTGPQLLNPIVATIYTETGTARLGLGASAVDTAIFTDTGTGRLGLGAREGDQGPANVDLLFDAAATLTVDFGFDVLVNTVIDAHAIFSGPSGNVKTARPKA